MGLLMIQGYLSSAGKSRNSRFVPSLILIHGVPPETARHIASNYKLIDAVSFCQIRPNLISFIMSVCPLDGIYTKLVGGYLLNYDYLISKWRCLKFKIRAWWSLNDLKNSVTNFREKPRADVYGIAQGVKSVWNRPCNYLRILNPA